MATGLDNIPGQAIRTCANELADVVTSIFNFSLIQSTIPSCYKTTTIVCVCERVMLAYFQSTMPDTLDPLQYAYRSNRSTSDAVAAALLYSLSYLENKNSNIRMTLVDYSYAFNTVIPHKLTHKLSALSLNPTLCDWLMDFLTGRPHSVRIGHRISANIITNVGSPQGCILSPTLYTLFTHDCWCVDNNLSLNTDKTKEMIVNMRKKRDLISHYSS